MALRPQHQQTIRARQPRGVPIGGQFAAKANPEADIDIGMGLDAPPAALLRPVPDSDREELDELIPQANRPEVVVAVVDAVAGGCSTPADLGGAIGMTSRQGSYYAEAARTLGLVERSEDPVTYSLTERGVEVLRMSDQERASAMSQAIAENAHVNTLIMDGDQALVDSWDADLADTTVERRLATIQSWASYFLASGEVQQARMATSRSEAMLGAERVVVARAPRPVAPIVRRCPRCNLELPSGTDLCNICD